MKINKYTLLIAVLGVLLINNEAVAQLRLSDAAPLIIDVMTSDPQQITELRQQLDVWGMDRQLGSVVVYLPHGLTDPVIRVLEKLNLNWQLSQQRSAALYQPAPATAGVTGSIPGFACYRTVEQTYADLSALAAANPTLAEWLDIGDSWQKQQALAGFDIQALVLGNQGMPALADLVIIAAMHAREYATAELATRFAEQLISDYGVDADTTWLLDHYRVHIIPQLNPDGRKIAEQQSTRFKRKNHNLDFCSTEVPVANGIDLNRNSSVLWNFGSGSSGIECDQTFRGPMSTSEPETEAIEAYLDNVFPDARPGTPNDLNQPAPAETPGLFISLHSFGELLLFPWEAVSSNSGNHAGLRSLARKLAFFNDYLPCQDCLGTAAGTTVDYAYGARGVAAYTFEIGNNFFESCAVFENTLLPDNLAALKFALKAARRPYLESSGPEITNAGVSISGSDGSVMITAMADDRRRFGGSVNNEPADPQHNIAGAVVSINAPPFSSTGLIDMQASDNEFDSPDEAIQVTLAGNLLAPGRNTVYIMATDSSGQSGPPSAVFVHTDTLFNDGFEYASNK